MRFLLWHPIIGIVSHNVDEDSLKAVIWNGFFVGADKAIELFRLQGGSMDTANAHKGDLVVRRESQANENPEEVGSVFLETIHAGSVPLFPNLLAETSHPDIAKRVRQLLTTSPTGNPWQGDLSQ